MKLILLGAPGAGKGTQSAILGDRYGIPTVSTGNLLRAAIKECSTEEDRIAKEYVERGELVPDDIIIDIVKKRIADEDCRKGFILDGMPRTIRQADALEESGIHIDCALAIEADDDFIIHRLGGRLTCSGCGASYHEINNPPKTEGKCDRCGHDLIVREDDRDETIRARIAIYHEMSEPLKEYYAQRGVLHTVDGTQGIEETTKAIVKALEI